MTRGEALREAAGRLRDAGIEAAETAARALAAEAFAMSPTRLLSEARAEAPACQAKRFEGLVARRLAGEPVDRILGRREFWGFDLRLSPDTLSPRADTETAVEASLAALRDVEAPRILDLGTGSGCILLALLAERPDAAGVGVDRALGAAAAAQANAQALGLAARAAFMVGDWTAALSVRFDLVVSNPPYIETAAIAGLDREVRAHDPLLALDGGADGLDAYRAILAQVAAVLAPGGAIVLELGAGQSGAVAQIALGNGLIVEVEARDLSGTIRVLTLRQALACASV